MCPFFVTVLEKIFLYTANNYSNVSIAFHPGGPISSNDFPMDPFSILLWGNLNLAHEPPVLPLNPQGSGVGPQDYVLACRFQHENK